MKYKPMSIESQMSTLNGTDISGSISDDEACSVSSSSGSNDVDIIDLDTIDFPVVIIDSHKKASKHEIIPQIDFE
jgi:hypothetical protein